VEDSFRFTQQPAYHEEWEYDGAATVTVATRRVGAMSSVLLPMTGTNYFPNGKTYSI
jgi:hypothetical protein